MLNDWEEFQVKSATLLTGLDADCFFRLIDRGYVTIDLRMHVNEVGGSRNRGTTFRANELERSSELLSKC